MCSCGITFGVSAMAAITSSVKSRGCGEVKRTRSSPSICSARPQQLGEGLPIAELRAVRVHVLAEQGDLLHPLGHQHLDLGQDLAGSPIGLPAAQRRHDAEGAGVVAADADRDPGGVGGVPPGRQRRGEPFERLGDLDLGLPLRPGPAPAAAAACRCCGCRRPRRPRAPGGRSRRGPSGPGSHRRRSACPGAASWPAAAARDCRTAGCRRSPAPRRC